MQRHYAVAITITTNTMAAAIWYSLRYSIPSKLASFAAASTSFLVQFSCNMDWFFFCDLQNTDKRTVKK